MKKEKNVSIYTVDYQIFAGGKPDWCPLKDVPEKKPFSEELVQGIDIRKRINIALHEAAALGWNACIDVILGEGRRDEQSITNFI